SKITGYFGYEAEQAIQNITTPTITPEEGEGGISVFSIIAVIIVILSIPIVLFVKNKINIGMPKDVWTAGKKPLHQIKESVVGRLKKAYTEKEKKSVQPQIQPRPVQPQQARQSVQPRRAVQRQRQVMAKMKEIEFYAKKALSKGFNKAFIREALLRKGWPSWLVDRVLAKFKDIKPDVPEKIKEKTNKEDVLSELRGIYKK
ncbi:hypothetical protein KY339_02630, partial [Candidatus Woesearchaeota archaeon]|nr:hypothetical protein [Candidatus Woesearchaeota archaeon]